MSGGSTGGEAARGGVLQARFPADLPTLWPGGRDVLPGPGSGSSVLRDMLPGASGSLVRPFALQFEPVPIARPLIGRGLAVGRPPGRLDLAPEMSRDVAAHEPVE